MATHAQRVERIARLVAKPSVSSAAPGWDQSNAAVIAELANMLEDARFRVEVLPLPGKPEKQNLMAWLLFNQTTRQTFWGPLMAGAVITSLPVVIFFLTIQKNIAAGLTAGAVKG